MWKRTGGVCVLCDHKIDGVGERWIVEPVRALELGGEDDLRNMGPAHQACALAKLGMTTGGPHGPNGRNPAPRGWHLQEAAALWQKQLLDAQDLR